jgi:hypothetical protein
MTRKVEPQLLALLHGFFEAVSFTDGPPAYDRIRDLFLQQGLLIRNTPPKPEATTVEAFITSRQHLVDAGSLTDFHEAEITGTSEVFGRVAHRLSSYTKQGVMDGSAFTGRGIISTQFIESEEGWRISSMAWDDERPGLSIPDHYLQSPSA